MWRPRWIAGRYDSIWFMILKYVVNQDVNCVYVHTHICLHLKCLCQRALRKRSKCQKNMSTAKYFGPSLGRKHWIDYNRLFPSSSKELSEIKEKTLRNSASLSTSWHLPHNCLTRRKLTKPAVSSLQPSTASTVHGAKGAETEQVIINSGLLRETTTSHSKISSYQNIHWLFFVYSFFWYQSNFPIRV